MPSSAFRVLSRVLTNAELTEWFPRQSQEPAHLCLWDSALSGYHSFVSIHHKPKERKCPYDRNLLSQTPGLVSAAFRSISAAFGQLRDLSRTARLLPAGGPTKNPLGGKIEPVAR